MANRFLDKLPPEETMKTPSQKENRFLKRIEGMEFEKPEKLAKSIGRDVYQPVGGFLKRWTWPADLLKLATEGASSEALAQLMEEDPSINRQIAEQARQKGMEYFPTQDLAEQLIEETTGLPLTPKTGLQKNLRLGGEAASFRAGGPKQKLTAAIAAPTIKEGLETAGLPEPIASTVGLGASTVMPTFKAKPITKDSGLTARNFEKLKKETKVSPHRIEKINETLEKEFRSLSEPLLEKNRTYRAIKEDTQFKDRVSDLFGKVQDLAEDIKQPISSIDLKRSIRERLADAKKKGLTSSESEKTFKKELAKFYKELPHGEAPVPAYVEQFRKNNKELGQHFEPGKSKAYNTGKRDALLEYNRAIAEQFEKKFPDSEFNKTFKFTNERWKDVQNVEKIDKFIDKAFKNKVSFNELRKLLQSDKENLRMPFKRIMGDEGFKQMEGLLKDLISMEKPYSLIKKAELAGFKDLAKYGAEYLLHPSLAKAHLGIKFAKRAFHTLLDKPQVAIEWRSAIKDWREGRYKEAQEHFRILSGLLEDEEAKNPQKRAFQQR